MPRSTTALALCATLAFAIALGCSDVSSPLGPKLIAIAAGDSQSANVGAALSTALKVRLLGTDNKPYPGVVVNWTVTQGVAVAQPPASVTNAAGEATTSLALGFQTGPVRVTASVEGVAPVVFTATAVVVNNFPCPTITPFGFGVSGNLDASDCNLGGYYLDVLNLTLPTQRTLSIRMTSSDLDPWLGFYTGNGSLLAMNDDSLLGTVRSSMLNVMVPAGSYLVTPTAFGPATAGTYTLTVYDRPAAMTGCEADSAGLSFMKPALHYTGSDRSALWLTRGVSFSDAISAADCVNASGPHYSDRAFIWLDSNSVLTVREASTAFDAYLTLYGPNNFRAFNDDSAGATTTTNAYLVVQAPVSAAYLLDFGTRVAGATGNYSISIAADPALPGSATRLGAARALVGPYQPRPRRVVVNASPQEPSDKRLMMKARRN